MYAQEQIYKWYQGLKDDLFPNIQVTLEFRFYFVYRRPKFSCNK